MNFSKKFGRSKTKRQVAPKNEAKKQKKEEQKEHQEKEKHLKHALANFMNPELEEDRVRIQRLQEQEKEHKELEKQTRYILKSVKLVSTKNYTTALSLSAVEKFDLIQKLANLWSFISYCEREITRTKAVNIIFMCVYFAQLFSISVSSISPSVDEDSLNMLYYIARSARVIPLLSKLNNSDVVGLILLIVICICDIVFFYCAWDLSVSSTKEEENNYKLKNVKTSIVQLYFEIYRWFLIIPKFDIVIGGIFCGVLHDKSIMSNVDRCGDMVSFTTYQGVVAFLSILQLFSILLSSYLFIIVYNTAGFMASNPIKPRYSNKKFIEFGLIFILVLFSYPQVIGNQVVLLIMQHLIGLYYQIEYFMQFPLLTREYTTIYANIINTYAFASILQTCRYSDNTFQDQNFVPFLSIISTFLIALQQSYIYFQTNRVRAFDLRDSLRLPNLACLYFEELIYLAKNSLREKKMYLIILGMLEFHQQRCKDVKCPCLKAQSFEDYGFDIPLSEAKLLNTPIGLYLYNLSKDHNQFVFWVMKFVDYHIRDLIKQLEKTHIQNNQVYQDVSMRFWFFAIRTQKNVIKALFSLKSNSKKFHNKSKFFQLLELATSRIIENTIKTRDKSMKYSYRQKDAEKARQFELFEHMVATEAIKKNIKKYLIEILIMKQNMMQKLINGYESFNELFSETLDLLKHIERLENMIRSELSQRKENIEYLRLLSILKIRLLNDPISCKELDKKIIEINDKDKFQDENTINSLNILRGNVVSMISGFSTQIASIIAFSESSPSFFGYKKSEFQTLSSLNDLIPECIAVWHDNYMIRLVETGVSKIIRRYRVAIAKNKVDPKGIIQDMSGNFFKFFQELYQKQIDRNVLTGSNIALIIPQLSEVFEHYDANKSTAVKFEVNLPRNYKTRMKTSQAFNNNLNNSNQNGSPQNKEQSENEYSKQSINDYISQSSKNYGMHYLSFEATCSIKQENIAFYNGGALILYLIEIQNYTPISPASVSTTQKQILNKGNGNTIGEPQSSIQQMNTIPYSKEKQIQVMNDKSEVRFYQDNSNVNADCIYSNIGGGSIHNQNILTDNQILEDPYNSNNNNNNNIYDNNNNNRQKYDQEMQVQDMDHDINNLEHMHINNVRQVEHMHFLTNSQEDFQECSPSNQTYPTMQGGMVQITVENNDEQNKYLMIHQGNEKDTKTSSSSDPFAGVTPQYQNQYLSMSTDQIQGTSLLVLTQNNLNETMNENPMLLNQSIEMNLLTPKNENGKEENEINVTYSYNHTLPNNEVKFPNSTHMSHQTSIFKQAKQQNMMEISKGNLSNINSQTKILSKKDMQNNQYNIPEEQLPFEGTSNQTEEFSQRFKDLSRKSGTVITFTSNHSKSDGEHCDNDDLNLSSSQEDIGKKGWEDDVHEQNSISSIGNRSTYNIVKQIHAMANEKRMPGFLMALYGSYTTQWALFVILSLITCIYQYNQFQEFKEILTNLQFSSAYMIPLSFFSLSGNYVSLSNSNIITLKNDDSMSFFFNKLLESYDKTKVEIDTFMVDELAYNYQDFIMNQQIKLKYLSSLSQTQSDINIVFFESFLKILDSSYSFIQNKSAIKENSSLLYLVQQNYEALSDQFDQLDQLFVGELDLIKSNIHSMNIQILVISILMFVIFSALIVPPFKKYRDQVIRILKTISRITEEEALSEIFHIKQANRLLESENEEYLITRFGEIQQKEEEEEQEMSKLQESKQVTSSKFQSSRKAKMKKEKPKQYSSVYLNDRVKNNKLSFWLVLIIIFVLVMCSCVFIAVYAVMNDFLNTFSTPIQDQLDFSSSIRYYGKMAYSKNMLLISQSISYYKTLNPTYKDFYNLDLTVLQQSQALGITKASSFLLGEFLQMGIKSDQSSNLRSFLQAINDGNTCELFNNIFLTTTEKNICLTASQGVINIGLKNAITASINTVKEYINWDSSLSYNYIQKGDYSQEIEVQQIVMKMFLNLQQRIGNDNKDIIDKYVQTILLIYIIGGTIITLLFLAISVYSLLNTLKNFTYLRKAIFLIPFKRLSEDSNTRFLLKKFMEVQSSCLC